MTKEEIKLSSKIENNGNEISLITIAFYQGKEYDLQDLLNNLLNELQRKDNIINDLKSSIADYQEAVGDYQDEIVRKDNNWNELKRNIKESDDCWDIDSILFMMEKLENGNK